MPCDPWPVQWPGEIPCADGIEPSDAVHLATTILRGLGPPGLGVCDYDEDYVPLCTGSCPAPYKNAAGDWINGRWPATCCKLLLNHGPIRTVTAVTVDGEALDAAEYAVRGRWLIRLGECWPCGEECAEAPIRVEYRAGPGFPPGTALAVGELATEIVRGWSGGDCKLPSNVISVSRQGVQIQRANPQDFLTEGLLGLPLADGWIRATNPGKLRSRSRVYSPDVPAGFRR